MPYEASDEAPELIPERNKAGSGVSSPGEVVSENGSGAGGIPAGPSESYQPDTLPSEPVIYAEVMPSFEGGVQVYLARHLTYPKEAVANSVQGKLYLEVVISEKGKLTSARVVKPLGYGCDEEAIKVVSSMPDWNPARMANRPVKSKLTIPINFRLD